MPMYVLKNCQQIFGLEKNNSNMAKLLIYLEFYFRK